MRIIPAIDLLDGKCVRLSQGDYDTKKIYSENPLEVAKTFENYGIKYLHLVDLDGAKSHQIINYKVLHEIATKTNLHVDFGGGLKSSADVKIAFDNGARQITGGSIAVTNPALFVEWLKTYGSDKIILGADFKDRKIATQGWLNDSDLEVLDFILNYEKQGVRYVISTDISKDGMLQGPSSELYGEIIHKAKINLIASGGVSRLADLELLKEIGCEAAIVGKAIYENKITLKDLSALC
jgi:phosphoribosylformimino-5-aminoimidazole carboxamide ribotide isomerase